MRLIVWLFRAFIFFALFAFALNNQQLATVRWFFGVEWRSPLVIIVLGAFAAGCAIGVLAMVPAWWHHRRAATRQTSRLSAPTSSTPGSAMPSEFGPEHPPREGL
ncbi:MAG: LapA family protein [Rubrivivax sp.]|nr:LapA family protein [Rubrivivax sp.]